MATYADKKRERGPPLLKKGGNFREWEIRMKGYLIQHGNAQTILNEETPGIDPEKLERLKGENGEETEESEEYLDETKEKKDEFDEKSSLIYSYLLEATESHPIAKEMVLGHEFGDGWGLYHKLVEKLAPRNVNEQLAEQARFNSLRMESGETATEFASRIEESASRLKAFGVEKSRDIDMVGVLKEGLVDKRYENFAMVLFIQPSLTWEFATSKIAEFEASSHFAGKKNPGTNTSESTSKCEVCHNNSHTSADCWKKRSPHYSTESGRRRPPPRTHGKRPPQAHRETQPRKKPLQTCYNCGKRGHIAKHCRKPRVNQDATGDKHTGSVVRYEGWMAQFIPRGGDSSVLTTCWSGGEAGEDRFRAHGHRDSTRIERGSVHRTQSCGRVNTQRQGGTENYLECIIDSGATAHIVNCAEGQFENYKACSGELSLAKSTIKLPTYGIGDVGLLKNCVHCPTITTSLISYSKLIQDGFSIESDERCMRIKRRGETVVVAQEIGNLYRTSLDQFMVRPEALNVSSSRPTDEFKLLHRRMMHANLPLIISAVQNRLIRGVEVNVKAYKQYSQERPTCTGCMKGKSSRASYTKRASRKGSELGSFISCDIISFSVETVNGERYGLTYTDHASKRSWSFLLKQKSEALSCLQRLNEVHLPAYNVRKVGHYHSDGARELIGHDTVAYLERHGIRYSWSEPYTPEHNGVSERKFKTLKGMTGAALFTAQLPKPFWGYAYLAATWVRNRLPTETAWGVQTPYQCWEGKPPNLHHLRTWGCKAFVHVEKTRRAKDFTEGARAGYLVGFTDTGYIVYDTVAQQQLAPSSNVKFDENIPSRDEEYWAELSESMAHEERHDDTPACDGQTVDSFQYLVGTRHLDDDDGLQYETVRVVDQRGYIVAYRSLVLADGTVAMKEEEHPIHVGDIVRLTIPAHQQRHAATQGEHTRNSRGAQMADESDLASQQSQCPSTERRFDMRLTENSGVPPVRWETRSSERELTAAEDSPAHAARDEEERRHEDDTPKPVRKGYRERIKRKITNVSTLGPDAYVASSGPMSTTQLVWQAANAAAIEDEQVDTPSSYGEAMSSPDATHWQAAIDKELNSLRNMHVFDFMPLPAGKRPLGSKLIFKIKRDKHGNITKYKARLVAQGFTQREGENFSETYAPVARASSIRIVLALAATCSLHLHQMDVVVAFLNAPLEEDIYMKPPKGMQCPEGKVLRLRKSLYGLKQAPRNWNNNINEFLTSDMGFNKCIADPCIYVKRAANRLLILVLYVDDMIIAGSHLQDITQFKKKISQRYNMEDLGELEFVLGMRVTRYEDGSIKLDHQRYATDILIRFGLQESHCVSKTPMEQGLKLTKADLDKVTDKDQDWINSFQYREKVGCLMYLAVCTRPDITYAVCTVARYMTSPTVAACNAVTRILKFVNATRGEGLLFRPGTTSLLGYSDASYGDCEDTGRSTAGAIFYLGYAPVTWWSRLLKTVAQSTAESEYMAISDASNEAIGLRNLLEELGYSQTGPTVIREDNKACMDLANTPKYQRRTKHIKIRWHAIRQHIDNGDIQVEACHTDKMLADGFTKALGRAKFVEHSTAIRGYTNI